MCVCVCVCVYRQYVCSERDLERAFYLLLRMSVCMYVCTYICSYTYTHTHTHTQMETKCSRHLSIHRHAQTYTYCLHSLTFVFFQISYYSRSKQETDALITMATWHRASMAHLSSQNGVTGSLSHCAESGIWPGRIQFARVILFSFKPCWDSKMLLEHGRDPWSPKTGQSRDT